MRLGHTYKDRAHAGRVLAEQLNAFRDRDDVIVLALPRGGVPVGAEVACRLHAPLDVFVVRKLGVPGHEELAMGAIASGGVRVLNEEVVGSLRLPEGVIQEVADREQQELLLRERSYRGDRPVPDLRDRTVILVDDGLATGSTMRAAVAALRKQGPTEIVVAVPVGAREVCEAFATEADEVVCAQAPEWFQAVSLWYEEFGQTTDEEVRSALRRAEECRRGSSMESGRHEVRIPVGEVSLEGTLTLPEEAQGVVLFAHGSGSSRHSPRNRFVAREMEEVGLGTLLFDLLTKQEEEVERFTAHLRFDIELLVDRLTAATEWVTSQKATRDLEVGYFGASTGAGAALVAAARRPERVGAVVSRGGRPDLAGSTLAAVEAPTLLIVGGNDRPVIELNRQAFAVLPVEKELAIVPGATHLFEEPGALEEVARLARDWFLKHLG